MSKYRITLEGKTYEMEIELVPEETAPQPAVRSVYQGYQNAAADPTVRLMDPSSQRTTTTATGTVTAPMPGTVLSLCKKEGEKIESIFLQNSDFPITVRNAKENDAILLRFGTKKLNRFFIDRKIPMALRKMWPVVVNQKGEVIFVPAIGPDVNHYCEIPNVFMVKL